MQIEVKIPAAGESITEVEISHWLKKDGEHVEKDEAICEVETDKATLPLFAEAGGVIHILAETGKTLKIGDVVCTIETNGAVVDKTKAITSQNKNAAATITSETRAVKDNTITAQTNQNDHYAKGLPSIAAEKLMAEKRIKIEEISGTGKDGRITKADVIQTDQKDNHPTLSSSSNDTLSLHQQTETPVTDTKKTIMFSRDTQNSKMTPLRKKISQRLVAVKNETAMLTTFNELDMSQLMAVRAQYQEEFQKAYQVKLGYMSFFTKAVSEALKTYKALNAYIDKDDLIYHDYVDVGIAVSAPKGLVVPVIRNAESLSLAAIEQEIARLASRARDNKITLDEMTGGTFSITNGGVFGSMLSTPILNPPQSAILGMHNIVKRPVVVNDQIVIRPIMYLALSYDHRIVDGRESVSFLVKLKELLENPIRLLLGV